MLMILKILNQQSGYGALNDAAHNRDRWNKPNFMLMVVVARGVGIKHETI